jgi:hypothetical protein
VEARRLKPLLWALPALLLGVVAGLLLRPHQAAPAAAASPEALADAALLAVRDQGQIAAYGARYMAVVKGDERLLGVLGQSNLLVPGSVRYGIDATRLRRGDLAWDAPTRTLTVTLPPLELTAPAIETEAARAVWDGPVASAAAAPALDDARRRAATDDILRQARAPAALAPARAATMRLVASAFAMPLRAAGVDASIAVRFVDPAGREEAAFLDRPRRLEDTLRDRQAGLPPAPRTHLGNEQ